MVSFDELVRRIGRASLSIDVTSSAGANASIDVPGPRSGPFIAPDFNPGEGFGDNSARAVLISAPAAVGKSSLAKELGRQTENTVWDLSRFKVGSAFFTGMIYEHFGESGSPVIRRAIREGGLTLILDAADEALVQAGSQNFSAAIDNLSSLLGRDGEKPSSSSISVVILGRPDTIDDVGNEFEKNGIAFEELKVAFFDERRARDFVKAKARRPEGRGVATKELDDFLDGFFQDVKTALGNHSWEAVESFLGYAPVLDALGAFYRNEDNPMRRLSEIEHGNKSSHVWDLLVVIIESILDRESEKFGQNFGGDDTAKRNFGQAAYDRESQIRYLLADEPEDVEIFGPIRHDTQDSWILEELNPRAQAQFREHPFVADVESEPNPLLRFASTAFRDYALASSIAFFGQDAAAERLDFWRDPRVSPSPMLSRFALSDKFDLTHITAEDASLVVDSHASNFQSSVRLDIESILTDSATEDNLLELSLLEDSQEVRRLQVKVPAGEAFGLLRAVARTSISCPDLAIQTGLGFQEFSLGPSFSMHAATLHSESREVRVNPSPRPNEVRVERILGSTRMVSAAGPKYLSIVVPNAAFPWQAFRAQPQVSEIPSNSDIHWAAMEIRRNTKWYLKDSQVSGGLNYPVEAMEAILGKQRASSEVHKFWLSRNELRDRDGTFYLSFPSGFGAKTVLDNDLEVAEYRSYVLSYVDFRRSTLGE